MKLYAQVLTPQAVALRDLCVLAYPDRKVKQITAFRDVAHSSLATAKDCIETHPIWQGGESLGDILRDALNDPS